MNKWVVLFLMLLAFLGGALSFQTMKPTASPTPAAAAVPATPLAAIPSASATVAAAPAPRGPRGSDPHFGPPPRGGAATGQGKKPGLVTGEIKAMIFATAADGEALTRFPSKTENVYLIVSPGSIPKDVELVASLRSVMKEGEAFSAPVPSSGPPRRRVFRFATPPGGWVSGPYQVVLKPAGSEQVLTLGRFEIEKPDAKPAPAFDKPEFLGLVSDLEAEKTSSVFHENDDKILLLVDSGKVPTGVKVRSVWSAVEVDQLAAGELVDVTEVSAPGPGQMSSFAFTPPKDRFLPGSYRVDVYFDQQPVGSQAFFIQPGGDQTASGEPSPGRDAAAPAGASAGPPSSVSESP
jgi:hypothetical protein